MLRDHSFLLYSESARAEYEMKLESASAHFRTLIRDSTGIELENDKIIHNELSRTNTASIRVAARILERTAAFHASKSKPERALPWLRAAVALRALK